MSEELATKLASRVPKHGHGRLLVGGVKGHRGAGGRPPNWLKDFCDDLLADSKCKTQVKAILQDKDHPAFATMWSRVAERAHGKAEQTVHKTEDRKVTLEVVFVEADANESIR